MAVGARVREIVAGEGRTVLVRVTDDAGDSWGLTLDSTAIANRERKVVAACTHQTMMRNFFHQLQMQAETGGWSIPPLDECLRRGDVAPLVGELVRSSTARTGERHGLAFGEEFRVVTFGGLEPLLDRLGTRR